MTQNDRGRSSDWRPTASLEAIRLRAKAYSLIRSFFSDRSVLEVETPILSASTATDPLLESFDLVSSYPADQTKRTHFLHTSPELPMKRLLASGSGDIFQICKTFRKFEQGSRHNPEFSMLEWYRTGFDLNALIREVHGLVNLVLNETQDYELVTYRDAFVAHTDLDPFDCEDGELEATAKDQIEFSGEQLERDGYIDLLFSHCVEPNLGRQRPTFLIEYPASQASLAETKTDERGNLVAHRFELYIDGLELANGYQELCNPAEQLARLNEDNKQRQRLGLQTIPIDYRFLSALESGLPMCSGVALGLDRLLMICLGTTDINDVISFPFELA